MLYKPGGLLGVNAASGLSRLGFGKRHGLAEGEVAAPAPFTCKGQTQFPQILVCSKVLFWLRRKWSASTSAIMLSTIGTALGSTHGSCRPFARSLTDSPSWVTVSCSKLMVAVGLNATRVEVVHPQPEVPAPTAHKRPRQQKIAGIAKMQVAAGGGGESGAEGFRNRNQLGLAISGTCCQTGLACWKA